MTPSGCLIVVLLVGAYLYVVYKITVLLVAGYNKYKLMFYALVLLLFTTIMWYTIYVKNYLIFILLLIIMVYSLLIAYDKLKK